ncbi:helix-turn-helix domain-containing protein [Candidatus Woesearchaeota archaeon]|nr:helix-turn-helix domain-containing protein [Candidatus Woesearchaeota archaeon]
MKDRSMLVRITKDGMLHSDCEILENPESIKLLSNSIRLRILKLLAETPMYPAELAQKLRMHEQKVYYHMKQMLNADLIEIVEKKEIRGTIAKKFFPKSMNFAVSLGGEWSRFKGMRASVDKKLEAFLEPFIRDGDFNAKFVVGCPDPHGPYKAAARDGHYAVDLALFMGQFCRFPKYFAVKLDVDVKSERQEKDNLIIVGGPGPNLVSHEINNFLPIKFDIRASKKGYTCAGLISEAGELISEDTAGIIARIPNPYSPRHSILFIAGYRYVGVKSAVIGFTRFHKEILRGFSGQDSFAVIVRGFDLDGDGKIDSVELV